MQGVRLVRVLLRLAPVARGLVAADAAERLVGLARDSPFGSVRLEALVTLMHLLDASGGWSVVARVGWGGGGGGGGEGRLQLGGSALHV